VPREHYRIGMPAPGAYTEIFNSDDARYGGSGLANKGRLVPDNVTAHGRAHSLALTLPPLAAIYLAPDAG
jgi:1,4-alpha-glucan branching enzyme